MAEVVVGAESKYTVGMFKTFMMDFVDGFVSALSLGLLKPMVGVWKTKIRTENTYINGKKLVFTGKASELYRQYIIWWLLSIVTLGIYGIFVAPKKMIEWQCAHTHFEGEEGESKFEGKVGAIIRLNILTSIFGFFAPNWAFCKRRKYYTSNVVIDGQRLSFDATALQYNKFNGKVWFLTVITLGIYGIWAPVKRAQWIISKTHLA